MKFITNVSNDYPDYYFIPQWMKEFQMTYVGNEKLGENTAFYPNSIEDRYYKENRVRFPLNAKSWINFMEQMDLAVGARLHGNITATIAGTPSLLLTKDARMKELAEYHNLTHLSEEELKEDVKLEEVINQLDFHSPEKVQAQNFDHFIYFLEKNGLDHIYNYDYYKYPPLDKEIDAIDLPEMLTPINALEPIEISNRLINYTKLEAQRKTKLKKENKSLSQKVVQQRKEIKKDKEKINKLNGQLQRKAVKMGIKFGDSLAVAKKRFKK